MGYSIYNIVNPKGLSLTLGRNVPRNQRNHFFQFLKCFLDALNPTRFSAADFMEMFLNVRSGVGKEDDERMNFIFATFLVRLKNQPSDFHLQKIFFKAAKYGHVPIVDLICSNAQLIGDINAQNQRGNTLLHIAVKHWHLRFVQRLLEKASQLDIDIIDAKSLDLAIQSMNSEMVVLLVKSVRVDLLYGIGVGAESITSIGRD